MMRCTIFLMTLFALGASVHAENRVTVLVDAFSRKPNLTKDWGYSALVEYNGKRILFDTGDNILMSRQRGTCTSCGRSDSGPRNRPVS
jgi:hypothetical protein